MGNARSGWLLYGSEMQTHGVRDGRRCSHVFATSALDGSPKKLPVVFVIMNNHEYNVLKSFMREQLHYVSAQAGRFIAMDIIEPSIDYVALARSMGVRGVRIEDWRMIGQNVAEALKRTEPSLIEIAIGC